MAYNVCRFVFQRRDKLAKSGPILPANLFFLLLVFFLACTELFKSETWKLSFFSHKFHCIYLVLFFSKRATLSILSCDTFYSIPVHELLCAQPTALFLVVRPTASNTTKPQNNSNHFHNTTSSRYCCIGCTNNSIGFFAHSVAIFLYALQDSIFCFFHSHIQPMQICTDVFHIFEMAFLHPQQKIRIFCKSCTLSKIWYKSSLVCSVFVSAACFGSTAFFGLFWVGSIAATSFQILYSLVVPIPKRSRINAGDSFPRRATISRISSAESFFAGGTFANIPDCRFPNGNNWCLVCALGF